MIARPGTLCHFAAHTRKQERFCWRMSLKKLTGFVRFKKSAVEHERTGDSVRDFIEGEREYVGRK